jgi:hypothetical protein
MQTQTAGAAGIVSYYPLSDGRYVFTAYAVDSKNLRDSIGIRDTITISGATTRILDRNSDWQMVSVPVSSISADLVKAGGSISHWNEAGLLRDVYSYYVPSNEITVLEAGKGYWRKSDSSSIISLDAGDLISTPVPLNLYKGRYGWNQVANPFAYPVEIDTSIREVWEWARIDSSGYGFRQVVSNVLMPWASYFVRVDTTRDIELSPAPVFNAGNDKPLSKARFTGKNDWSVAVSLTGGKSCDVNNSFGVAKTASNGYDHADLYKPPVFSDRSAVFFVHPDAYLHNIQFASDIRGSLDGEDVFQIGITPGASTANRLLSFGGIENLQGVYLFIGDAGSMEPVQAGKAIVVPQSDKTLYKTLFVSDNPDFLKSFPRAFAMNSPYPNPCRPSAKLHYVLPYRWDANGLMKAEEYTVRIVIYDVLGRVVRDVAHRTQKPGFYSVLWDGKTNAGRLTSAGTYFITLTAGEFKSVKTLTVMR